MTDFEGRLRATLRAKGELIEPWTEPDQRVRVGIAKRRRRRGQVGIATVLVACVTSLVVFIGQKPGRLGPPVAAVTEGASTTTSVSSSEPRTPSEEPTPSSATTTLTVLPDGSELPSECEVPSSQHAELGTDEVFVATDDCGTGFFSLAEHRMVRYLATGLLSPASVAPNEDVVWVKQGACGTPAAIYRVPLNTTEVNRSDIRQQPDQMVSLLSASAHGAAWISSRCTSDRPEPLLINVDADGSRQLRFEPGSRELSVGGLALSDSGQVAVALESFSFEKCRDRTAPVDASGNCASKISSGIAFPGSSDTTVPNPVVTAGSTCAFGPIAWRGGRIVAVETCWDASRGRYYGASAHESLVTVDAALGRMHAIALPSWGSTRGIRVAPNGDVLVSKGSAKFVMRLFRVSGNSVQAATTGNCDGCPTPPVDMLP
ncbi:MAG: hypothetical protein JWM93_515 [Frankiales bacterium]|nr:hypothetical protein [Frankiales bacterium]